MLAVVGGESFAFGADFAAGTMPNAAFAEHLAQLRAPEGFTVVALPPFVVIVDESPACVRLGATDTIKWAVETGVAGRWGSR